MDVSKKINDKSRIFYWSKPTEPYLTLLREENHLLGVVSDCKKDIEKIQRLCFWVHSLWKHDGFNEPEAPDPISILRAVREGKRFRCVEYSTVLHGCLNAVGIPSRIVGLMTADVETRESGAGHIVVEAYLGDCSKWVIVDPQWDMIPIWKQKPLHALEFRKAIETNRQEIYLLNHSGVNKAKYLDWIFPYLYYLRINTDNRVGNSDDILQADMQRQKSQSLIFVPDGAKQPTVFQRRYTFENVSYINDESEFYLDPVTG